MELEKIYNRHLENIYCDPEQDSDSDQDPDQEKININDYKFAEEENEFNSYVALLNIYTCYFKQLFRRQQDETMFDHLDEKKDSTNKCMECLYDEIYKYNKSDEPDKNELYDLNEDNNLLEDFQSKGSYVLYLNNTPLYVCKYLLPLLQYLTTIDWPNSNWSIIPL